MNPVSCATRSKLRFVSPFADRENLFVAQKNMQNYQEDKIFVFKLNNVT